MRIYITHCAATKDESLKGTGRRVPPDLLYTATPTRRFMKCCKARGVPWAIFSDHYGVWFGDEEREWYPGMVRVAVLVVMSRQTVIPQPKFLDTSSAGSDLHPDVTQVLAQRCA